MSLPHNPSSLEEEWRSLRSKQRSSSFSSRRYKSEHRQPILGYKDRNDALLKEFDRFAHRVRCKNVRRVSIGDSGPTVSRPNEPRDQKEEEEETDLTGSEKEDVDFSRDSEEHHTKHRRGSRISNEGRRGRTKRRDGNHADRNKVEYRTKIAALRRIGRGNEKESASDAPSPELDVQVLRRKLFPPRLSDPALLSRHRNYLVSPEHVQDDPDMSVDRDDAIELQRALEHVDMASQSGRLDAKLRLERFRNEEMMDDPVNGIELPKEKSDGKPGYLRDGFKMPTGKAFDLPDVSIVFGKMIEQRRRRDRRDDPSAIPTISSVSHHPTGPSASDTVVKNPSAPCHVGGETVSAGALLGTGSTDSRALRDSGSVRNIAEINKRVSNHELGPQSEPTVRPTDVTSHQISPPKEGTEVPATETISSKPWFLRTWMGRRQRGGKQEEKNSISKTEIGMVSTTRILKSAMLQKPDPDLIPVFENLSKDPLPAQGPVHERQTVARILIRTREFKKGQDLASFDPGCSTDRQCEIARAALAHGEISGYQNGELGTTLLSLIRHYPGGILAGHYRREKVRACCRRSIRCVGGRGYEERVKLGMDPETCEFWNTVMNHFTRLILKSVHTISQLSGVLSQALVPDASDLIDAITNRPSTGEVPMTANEALDLVRRIKKEDPTDDCLLRVESLVLAPDARLIHHFLRNPRFARIGDSSGPKHLENHPSGAAEIADALTQVFSSSEAGGGAGLLTVIEALLQAEMDGQEKRLDTLFRADTLRTRLLASAAFGSPSAQRWLRRTLGPIATTIRNAPVGSYEVDVTRRGPEKKFGSALVDEKLLGLLDSTLDCLESGVTRSKSSSFPGNRRDCPRSVRAVCRLVRDKAEKNFPGLGDHALTNVFVSKGVGAALLEPQASGLVGRTQIMPENERALVYVWKLVEATATGIPLRHPLEHLQDVVKAKASRMRRILDNVTRINEYELLEHPSDSESSSDEEDDPSDQRIPRMTSIGISSQRKREALVTIKSYIGYVYDDLIQSLETASAPDIVSRKGRTRQLVEAVLASRVLENVG